MRKTADIAVVGGGIAGLAHAYMALRKGYKVVLFERDHHATGASIRNFGLLWPIGQEAGEHFETAFKSRHHWQELATKAGFWINNNGSLHLAYHHDEWEVLNEFSDTFKTSNADFELISPAKVLALSPIVRKEGLIGALYSRTESTVYSREAVRALTTWMEKDLGLTIRRGSAVTEISLPLIKTNAEAWLVSKVIVCSGADFETLFPHLFRDEAFVKCKLQMMRLSLTQKINAGPALCAGLTLRHYRSFSNCKSLAALDSRYDSIDARFKEFGIHVLVSQTSSGDLIVGDSHQYALTHDPFDSEEINRLILDYFQSFINIPDINVVERWNGIYPKLNGNCFFVNEPEPDVHIVNGLGGAGMTLSFGIAEKLVESF
jgi:D-hydroxyproline dehydrogenase subunit beta